MNSLCRGFSVLNRNVVLGFSKQFSLLASNRLTAAAYRKQSIVSEMSNVRSGSYQFLSGQGMRSLSAFTKMAEGIPKYAVKNEREEGDESILSDRDNDFYGGSTVKRYSGSSSGKFRDGWKDRSTYQRKDRYQRDWDEDGEFDSYSSSGKYKSRPKFERRPMAPPKSKSVRKLIRKYNLVDFGKNRGPIEVDAVETDYHEKLAETGSEDAGFSKYNLPPKLLERMTELGYTSPFKIQAATLEHTLNGHDVFAKAFTGSGKTLSFAIPIIKKLSEIEAPRRTGHPRCLVLSPTRELCQQIHDTLQKLAPNLKCMATYGGINLEKQIFQLRGHVDIVCATPGRLRDLFKRQYLKTSDIKIMCLDEADALLKPDFMEQIEDIIQSVKEKQMLMFSATLSEEVEHLLDSYMNKPKIVDLTRNESMPLPKNINHYLVQVRKPQTVSAVKHLIEKFDSEKCILFVNRIADTQFYANALNRMGIRASAISSDKTQAMRSSIIRNFKQGNTKVLVATDVAARGLDVPTVNLIMNIGSSSNGLEAYIHRSGRTGRAGKIGSSIVIDNGADDSGIEDIKQLIKLKKIEIPEEALESSPAGSSRFDRYEERDVEQKPKRIVIRRNIDDQEFETRRFQRKPSSMDEFDDDSDDDFDGFKKSNRETYSRDRPTSSSSRFGQGRPNKWRVD